MGYKYTGDALLGVSLTVNTPKPLDSRSVVNNLSELYSVPAATAYQGMTVSNVANGNIYMLVDKSKINEKAGWKASYESIQIITCTEQEYNIWKDNTNEDFTPKDDSQTYLHEDTYYYIYEDSLTPETESQQYLSRMWGENIEAMLSTKASNDSIININKEINNINSNISENYLNKNIIIDTYATKELLNITLSEQLLNYYTKIESDDKFVTKDFLTNEDADSSNYIFVTQQQLSEYKDNVDEQFTKTLKTEEDGSVKNLTVETLKSSQENLNIETNELQINSEKVALSSEVPVIITLGQSEYDNLENKQDDVYYYTYQDSEENGVVTTIILNDYYKKSEVDLLIAELKQKIITLEEQINLLQNPTEDEV